MRLLHILVDNTTRGTQRSKYGESNSCWCAFKNRIEGMPCRAGAVYNECDGPNKAFYVGIIQALEVCFSLPLDKGTVWVKGDNQHVINQLKGEIGVGDLIDYHVHVKRLEVKYEESGKGIIRYEHINEQDEIYKKVDCFTKQFDNYLKQRLVGQTR